MAKKKKMSNKGSVYTHGCSLGGQLPDCRHRVFQRIDGFAEDGEDMDLRVQTCAMRRFEGIREECHYYGKSKLTLTSEDCDWGPGDK